MKPSRLLLLAFLLFPHLLFAWDYSSTDATTQHSAQLRVGADFTKKFNYGLALHLSEDLRFDMFAWDLENATLTEPDFNKSYTSLSLSYKPVRHLKMDAGYTLKIMGNKDWTDVNKWMRHRVFMSVTGSYKYEQWSFSLRERVFTEIRMGDIDLHTATGYYEHNRADWYLRSKVEVAYHVMSKPLKPYAWVEVVNTLNVNPLQQKYKDNDPTNTGHQYIRRVRTAIGTTWRLDSRNSLDFYYRFNYGYDRDITVKKKAQTILLTEEISYQHAIGICYNFGW